MAGFFFMRLYIEILDLVPIMSLRVAGIPPEQVLPLARIAWFDLFWRGIAAQPEEALPFLEVLRASQRTALDQINSSLGRFPL